MKYLYLFFFFFVFGCASYQKMDDHVTRTVSSTKGKIFITGHQYTNDLDSSKVVKFLMAKGIASIALDRPNNRLDNVFESGDILILPWSWTTNSVRTGYSYSTGYRVYKIISTTSLQIFVSENPGELNDYDLSVFDAEKSPVKLVAEFDNTCPNFRLFGGCRGKTEKEIALDKLFQFLDSK